MFNMYGIMGNGSITTYWVTGQGVNVKYSNFKDPYKAAECAAKVSGKDVKDMSVYFKTAQGRYVMCWHEGEVM